MGLTRSCPVAPVPAYALASLPRRSCGFRCGGAVPLRRCFCALCGGFFVNQPKILIGLVFYIAVWGFCGDWLSAHTLCLNARFYFLADVFCVPFRHDIDKRRKL